MSKTAYNQVMDAAAQQGWSQDSIIHVITDFIDKQQLGEGFSNYLFERTFEETYPQPISTDDWQRVDKYVQAAENEGKIASYRVVSKGYDELIDNMEDALKELTKQKTKNGYANLWVETQSVNGSAEELILSYKNHFTVSDQSITEAKKNFEDAKKDYPVINLRIHDSDGLCDSYKNFDEALERFHRVAETDVAKMWIEVFKSEENEEADQYDYEDIILSNEQWI